MRHVTFDLDAMRGFVTAIELGSFARAAQRLARSTSAMSAQLRKLEEQAGAALVRKAGRGLALTDAGETVLAYGRRLIELNDEATAALHAADLAGWVRLGVQEDCGDMLPPVLSRFARAHPRVRVEARVGRNAELVERIAAGRLDLALAWQDGPPPPGSEPVSDLPMGWIAPAAGGPLHPSDDEPLALALFEAPCLFRTAATAALDRAGIPWRVAFTSASLSGLWAAAAAGIGLTLRTPLGLPPQLAVLGDGESPAGPMPRLTLQLLRAEAAPPPAVARLAQILREEVARMPGA